MNDQFWDNCQHFVTLSASWLFFAEPFKLNHRYFMFTDYKKSRKFSYKSFSITTAINSVMLYIRFVLAQINPVIITQMSPP